MTFKTAQESFETALQIAEETGDSSGEHIAAGLIDLTKAIKTELARLKADVDTVKNKIR